jgi:hypothetical protein
VPSERATSAAGRYRRQTLSSRAGSGKRAGSLKKAMA